MQLRMHILCDEQRMHRGLQKEMRLGRTESLIPLHLLFDPIIYELRINARHAL